MNIDTSAVYTAQIGRTTAAQAVHKPSSSGAEANEGPGNDHDNDDLGVANSATDGSSAPTAHRGNVVNTKA